ncbi:MAG: DUF2931 family protein [Janthinobacterium lividum]
MAAFFSSLLASLWPSRALGQARLPAYQTEKFRLSAGPCAADGYWVTIQGGSFINSQGRGFPVPGGHTLEGNWGASGTAWAVGDEMQAVPERLSMLWFSYAEDKFYQGEFALPQEKIYALLKAGYWNQDKKQHDTYNEFTVCVLPKGVVVVWLTGSNQVLVGRFQAAETFPSADAYERYYGPANRAIMVKETQAELPAAVQQEIETGTISTKKWDDYLLTYPWQVAFNQSFNLYRLHLTGFNAERFVAPLTRELAPYQQFILAPGPKPVPRKLYLYGTTEHGAHYVVRVKSFDEAETMAAFQRLHQLSPGSPITLLFTLDKPFQKATLTLKNDRNELALTKSTVEVLSED